MRCYLPQSRDQYSFFSGKKVRAASRRSPAWRAASREFRAASETAFDNLAKTAKSASLEAGKRFKEAYIIVEGNFKRKAAEVNAKYDVTGKAQQAAEQVSEQAKEVDRRVGVKRRLRNLADDFQRKLPMWRRQYSSFSKTGLGQATFLGGIFLLFYTGIAFKLLNLLFILWWLAPFLFILFNKLNPQAGERAKRERAARQAQQNAFFQNAFFNNSRGQQRQRPDTRGHDRRVYHDPSSQVIDVEYTTIDEHQK